ncbi:MAG: pyridoxal-phosphate dependent enzyme [Phycisphaeraceae bacterium]|nr:pyridoxal-phosphate dependent enzyme [Phycisphaerales bacterium]MCB9860446.1 pyridoxal-phosphate dependent enzyme [Phycisphaeraceae bacterium]
MPTMNTILDAIGRTPLVKLHKIPGPNCADVYAKCEFMNPAGSIKDRMACYIIDRAEEEGLLKPGGTIVENTSGNTGMGLAMTAAVRGYRTILTMPDKMSQEKIDMLKGFGAEVIVTATDVPGDSDEHYVNVAKNIAKQTPNSFYVNQYHTQWNIDAHEHLTGKELWEETNGEIDAIVAGVGTGGTISGIGRYFKKHDKAGRTKIIGVDPLGSLHYHYFHTGEMGDPYVYKLEGIGEDIICQAFDTSVVDEMYQVGDREGFQMARRLTREEGLFCGGSSGAIMHIAMQVAERFGKGKKVVSICPDNGSRYITKHLSDAWMKDHGMLEPDRGLGLVEDLLESRSWQGDVVTMHDTDSVGKACEMMRNHGISQIPITDAHRKPIGIVHEIDILRGLQSGTIGNDSAVKGVMHQLGGMVYPKAVIEELSPIFEKDQIAVVVDSGKVVGVVSQIDLIEYLAKRSRS